jgi:hypothetical protein
MRDIDIPTRFVIPWANSAGPSTIRAIPVASQISITPGAASLTDGFPPLTMQPEASGGVPPFGQDWNGILQQITKWNQWSQAGAPVGYDATFSTSIGGYPNGAVLSSAAGGGNYWISTVDNNTSNPDAGGANWAAAGSSGGILQLAVPGAATTYTQGQNNLQLLRSNSGAAMQDTLPGTSPGVLANGTITRITNSDATALLSVKAGAGAVLNSPRSKTILGPGQSAIILSDGANYRVVSIPDRVISSGQTIFVAATGGNDANDGLTNATPLSTIQAAWNLVFTEFDLDGGSMTASCSGSFLAGTDCHGPLVGKGSGAGLDFVGVAASIGVNSAASFCFGAGGGATIGVHNFGLSNNSGPILFTDGSGSVIIQGGNIFGGGGPALLAAAAAQIVLDSNYTIANGETVHYQAVQGGQITQGSAPVVVTITGTPAFSTAFAVAGSLGFIAIGNVTFTGAATGQRYQVSTNAVISVGGGGANFIPGNSAGSATTGGQYGA